MNTETPASSSIPRTFSRDVPEVPSVRLGSCALCSSTSFEQVTQGYDYELQTCRNLWSILRCRSCSHVQLDPRPDIVALDTIYPAHYYSYNMAATVHPLALWAKSRLDSRKLSFIVKKAGIVPVRYLDVGCGDAKYLAAMQKKGVLIDGLMGLELNDVAVEHARSRGFNVMKARIEDCETVDRNSVDLVTMFHVIEHVDNPVACIRKLHDWLRPGGVLALETPNIDSIDARIFRNKYWGGYHIPRHWHFFSAPTLARVLDAAGFDVSRPKYVSGHSFWMYSFHHFLKYNSVFPMPRLATVFDPLRSVVIIGIVTAIDLMRALFGARTSSMLLLARKRMASDQKT